MKNLKEKIFLKKLNIKKDITKKYQSWMNDYEVNKYTEQKYVNHSIARIKKFVNEKNKSKDEILLGIFIKKGKSNLHIGNIKLGPINFTHKNAEVSYLIGEKQLWGKGYASKAIKEIIKLAKKKGIKKLKAGFYEMNSASKKVLEKNGFKPEGALESELIFESKRITHYLYGKKL